MNPDAHELGVDNIHKHLVKTVSESPFFPIEAVDLLEKMGCFDVRGGRLGMPFIVGSRKKSRVLGREKLRKNNAWRRTTVSKFAVYAAGWPSDLL